MQYFVIVTFHKKALMKLFKTLILACVTFVGCTEIADLDPRDRFVEVYAILENTDIQTVNLTYTAYLTENEYLPVEDAEVLIEKIDGKSVLEQHTFKKVKDGCWQANFTPKAGEQFKLTVKVPKMKEVTAYTEFPDSLKYWGITSWEDVIDSGYPDRKHRRKKAVYWISFYEYLLSEDSYRLCDDLIVSSGGHISDRDNYYDPTESYRIVPNHDSPYLRDSAYVYVEKRVVDFYSYGGQSLVDLYNDPVTRIHTTDIKNKYYDKLNPELGAWTCHPESCYLIQTLSADYDRYLIETYKFYLGIDKVASDDLTHLWDYSDVYTNIENGTGIFGATYKLKIPLQEIDSTDFYKYIEIK